MFVPGGNVSTGATFTSLTTTSKLFVTLNGGTPLSVTAIVTVFVPGPWASPGVQLINPFVVTVRPAGPFTSVNVSPFVGTSLSVALATAFQPTCSRMFVFGGTVSTGATFTSLTTTSKLFVTLNAGTPLSVTAIVTVFVPGPWPSSGVQLINPFVVTVRPAGPFTSVNVSPFVGTSLSVALATAFQPTCSRMFVPGGNVSTGATFTSLTTTSKLFVTLNAGTPLSVTAIVTVFVPGPWPSSGVQLINPFVVTVNPLGPFTSVNVSPFVGTSLSVALASALQPTCSTMFVSPGTVSAGALFNSVTITSKLFVTLKGGTPLSVTTVVIVFVPGPCASPGVHVITPLLLMTAPAGGLTN
jgi:hypothetical protein